jgi:hypothetical protein
MQRPANAAHLRPCACERGPDDAADADHCYRLSVADPQHDAEADSHCTAEGHP